MTNKQKMDNTKKLLVSFLTILGVLCLVATQVSAYTMTGDLADTTDVVIELNNDPLVDDVAVIAGETAVVKVFFTSLVNADNVRLKVDLEGDKVDVSDRTAPFDVELGKRYSKTLTLKVPFELRDILSDDLELSIKIWNGDYESEVENVDIRVQRPSYNADIKSVTVPNMIEAGETFPVEIVLKNMGYNDLDDVFVTAKISALGMEKSAYFGDLFALGGKITYTTVLLDATGMPILDTDGNEIIQTTVEGDEDNEDTVSGKLFLKLPFDVQAGVYTLEVEVTNEDTVNSVAKQIVVKNDFTQSVIAAGSSKNVAVNEKADYDVLIVNPTDKVKVYRIVTESSGSLSSSASESIVAVAAGSSKTVTITASADSEGTYNFNVNVFSGDELVETIPLTANVEGNKTISNPIVVLTIILAIVFVVLLVVLIVLIGKKPETPGEFGESYY
ncbi:MAG: hypothetical protein ABIA78_01220 [archaeon]